MTAKGAISKATVFANYVMIEQLNEHDNVHPQIASVEKQPD